MNITTVICTCGKVSCEFEQTGRVTEISRLTGFKFIWNISNGLSPIWLCPNCFLDVKNAYNKIISIVKHNMFSLTGIDIQSV